MQRFFHNHPILKGRRKDLRNEMTPEEVVLWNYLKNSKLGFKFRRQTSIGPYITDFYCSKAKLIIELDGLQHLNAKDYDNERDSFLFSHGYKVLRFFNKEIHENITYVINTIKESLENTTSR